MQFARGLARLGVAPSDLQHLFAYIASSYSGDLETARRVFVATVSDPKHAVEAILAIMNNPEPEKPKPVYPGESLWNKPQRDPEEEINYWQRWVWIRHHVERYTIEQVAAEIGRPVLEVRAMMDREGKRRDQEQEHLEKERLEREAKNPFRYKPAR